MLNPQTRGFILHFARAYPARTGLLAGLLLLAGLAEGFGIISLLPLLELAFNADSEPSALSTRISDGLASVGLAPRLEVLLLLIVTGMALKAAFHLLAMKQVGYTVARVATDLRLELIRSLLATRWAYFITQPTGRFANAVGAEVNRASVAYRAVCAVAAAGMQAIMYATVAFLISWQIAAFAIAAGTTMILLFSRLVGASRIAGRNQTQLMNSLASRLTDVLQGIKPIKAMGRERHLKPLLEHQTQGINEAQQRQVLASELLKALQEPVLVVFLAIALYVTLLVGGRSFAAVMIMALVFYRLAGRITLMQVEYQSIVVGESAFWAMRSTIDDARAQREHVTTGQPAPRFDDTITLRNVSFSYGDRPILDRIDLTIERGQFVAVVGGSGAGKTTLADIVTGMYAPSSGEVLIDGVNLADLDGIGWRHMIGYVPQEILLFHDTLLNNITLGDPDISAAAVERALRMAGAWAFVQQLPLGLETVLGERGSRLSGGQRQRISIARALVTSPALLILDEATASLDPETEAAICETLADLPGDVTIISISHKPTMTAAADVVYHLEEGRLRQLEAAIADIPRLS